MRLRQTRQMMRAAFPPMPRQCPADAPLIPFSESGDASSIDVVAKTGGASWFTQVASFKNLISIIDLDNSQPTGKSHLAVSVRVHDQSITPYALESWQPGTGETYCSLSQTRHAGMSLFVSNPVSLVARSAQTDGNVGRKQWRTRTGCYRTQKRRVPASDCLDQTRLRATSRQRCPATLRTLNLRVPRRTRCFLPLQLVCFSSDASVESSSMGEGVARKKVIPTDPLLNPSRNLTDASVESSSMGEIFYRKKVIPTDPPPIPHLIW